ncbi:glycosyltransferase [Paenibacillus silvae]|uniref:glycosyltransferase n=1 Tax=Paenibacillus silvae TaxID=1325358 RepID=UPI002003FFFE|nr:glycosyltransferase [Paenibacillus silvae]MCK6077463.1 glycosyltransferase [Paenibacillus silvae]MCK6151805.1 glycosyltransferase [Paenibacillus silvae]MCK6270291.1 glycosyltransferase [Paenibacillus silvae]
MNRLSTRNKILVTATVIMSCIYVIWRTFFTIPFGHGPLAVTAGLALLIVELIGMFELAVHFYNMTRLEYPELPVVDEALYPDVDVFIATYNEPASLLFKTINGCLNMDYPDRSKVHIYLCDDSNRPEMRELAAHMGIRYLTRTEHIHAKAGNLNNAMKHTSSPLIATFDADMIPKHDFLTSCVPYFLTGEKIGFVQTPQSFYNPDQFQYNLYSEARIPNEQDYFYRDVQVGRNKSNSVIYGGTNTVLSRQALEDVGGFYTGSITEDFATGIEMQSKGYRCYATNKVLASGLAPGDLKSLIKQRQRWARGCIQTGRKLNILFKRGLTFAQRLNYISSITYWYAGLKRLLYIMSPILFAVFGVLVVKCTILEILVFWLPMYLLTNTCLRMLSGNIRTTKWTNVYETILFPSLLPAVILETLGITMNKFAVTRKDGAHNDRSYQIKQIIPHLILAVLSVIGIVNCIHWTFSQGTIGFLVVLYWLLINFYNIMMSIFFLIGRKVFRNYERVLAAVECTLTTEEETLSSVTYDISEGGISILLDTPRYIPSDAEFGVQLVSGPYSSEFKAKVTHVTTFGTKWKYAFKVHEINEAEQRQLLHIVYDREPTLPQKLDKDISTFEDIRLNFVRRGQIGMMSNRKLARISLNHELETSEYGTVTLLDFNYDFILLQMSHPEMAYEVRLPLAENLILDCEWVKSMRSKHGILYRVRNIRDIARSGQMPELEALLKQWNVAYIESRKPKGTSSYKNFVSDDELNEMAYL